MSLSVLHGARETCREPLDMNPCPVPACAAACCARRGRPHGHARAAARSTRPAGGEHPQHRLQARPRPPCNRGIPAAPPPPPHG
eukprot:5235548-Alexandrium_andersonii.AAC.1